MDFNEAYDLLLKSISESEDIDRSKSNHEQRNLQIKRSFLAQKEAERINYENKKRIKKSDDDKKKRMKLNTILNALSTN